MPAAGQTYARVLLGARLAARREAAEVTTQEVQDAGLMSKANLWRIETGQVSISPANACALALHYRAGVDELLELSRLARRTTERGAWWPYRSVVPVQSRLYMDMETYACGIIIWEDGVIPAELQLEPYARAHWLAARPTLSADAIDGNIRVRLHRQQILLDRDRPPRLAAVIGEGALRRQVGGPDTMARQLDHLRELDERDDVDIRYLPFTAGALPATAAAFRILTVAGPPTLTWVYVENNAGATCLGTPDEVSTYRLISDRLLGHAKPIREFEQREM